MNKFENPANSVGEPELSQNEVGQDKPTTGNQESSDSAAESLEMEQKEALQRAEKASGMNKEMSGKPLSELYKERDVLKAEMDKLQKEVNDNKALLESHSGPVGTNRGMTTQDNLRKWISQDEAKIHELAVNKYNPIDYEITDRIKKGERR